MYNPDIHHRRSIRLPDYDYSQPGSYFVTICTQNRTELFGDVIGGIMQLNDAGKMVEYYWKNLPQRYPNVLLDAFIVMPNHIHVLFQIVGATIPTTDRPGQPQGRAPTKLLVPVTVGASPCGCPSINTENTDAQTVMPTTTIGEIIGAYKSLTTNEYIRGVCDRNWPSFPGRLWQRNYYEHIVRDDDGMNRIRAYIADNPRRWENGDMNFQPVV